MTEKEIAGRAAQLATMATLDLMTIARFGDGEKAERDAHAAEGRLMRATKLAMELAGFHPDEEERGQLYRALVDYISTLADD